MDQEKVDIGEKIGGSMFVSTLIFCGTLLWITRSVLAFLREVMQ